MENIGDKPSLAAATLVCHTWLAAASHSLFLSLKSRHRPEDYPIDCADEMLLFLAKCERAQMAVQILTLTSSLATWRCSAATLTSSTLLWNLSRLPRLRSLALQRICQCVSDDSGTAPISLWLHHPAITPVFPVTNTDFKLELDNLEIHGVDGFGLGAMGLRRILESFTSIRTLWISDATIEPQDEQSNDDRLIPTQSHRLFVLSLRVDCPSVLGLLAGILDFTESPKQISLCLDDYSLIPVTNTFLKQYTHVEIFELKALWDGSAMILQRRRAHLRTGFIPVVWSNSTNLLLTKLCSTSLAWHCGAANITPSEHYRSRPCPNQTCTSSTDWRCTHPATTMGPSNACSNFSSNQHSGYLRESCYAAVLLSPSQQYPPGWLGQV